MRFEWQKIIIKRFSEYLNEKKNRHWKWFHSQNIVFFLCYHKCSASEYFFNMPYLVWRRSFDYFVWRMSGKVSETEKNFYFLLLSTCPSFIIYFILIYSFTFLDLVIPRGFCPCEATGNDVLLTLFINMCYARPLQNRIDWKKKLNGKKYFWYSLITNFHFHSALISFQMCQCALWRM